MQHNRQGKTMHILLVEDNPADVLLMQEGLDAECVPVRLDVVTNGDDALDYLHRRGRYGNSPHPDLVMLDLNLPKRDGREVLAEIKQDPQLRHIPVLVITTSSSNEDVRKSYDLHANCFITKPAKLSQFLQMVKGIEQFWFNLATLPAGEHHGR